MNVYKFKATLLNISNKYSLSENAKTIESITSDSITVRVAFLGEFNSGKSTLINALLGQPILPMFSEPTTAAITQLSSGAIDRFTVVEIDKDSNEIERQINRSDLAREITTPDAGKRVNIVLKDIGFLTNRISIVDTPGVSSIEELHDDVTFGYLPLVDVAMVVHDTRIGGIPHSLIAFLQQFPTQLREKICFVLNFADLIPPSDINNIVLKCTTELTRLVANPRIVLVSAKRALSLRLEEQSDEYAKTGVAQLQKILEIEIPELKKVVEEKRMSELLVQQASNLINLLIELKKSITWTDEELEKSIQVLQKESEELERDYRQFVNNFENVRLSTLRQVKAVVEDSLEVIATQITNDTPIDNEVNNLVSSIKETVEQGVKSIGMLNVREVSMSSLLNNAIVAQASKIKDIADLVTDIATFALTVWLIPGASGGAGSSAGASAAGGVTMTEAAGGAGVVAVEKAGLLATNSAKTIGKFSKFLGMIGNVIKSVNPLEKVKSVILPYVLEPRLRNSIPNRIVSRVDTLFDELQTALQMEIDEKYMVPLSEKQQLLQKERDRRTENTQKNEKLHQEIENDMVTLNQMKSGR